MKGFIPIFLIVAFTLLLGQSLFALYTLRIGSPQNAIFEAYQDFPKDIKIDSTEGTTFATARLHSIYRIQFEQALQQIDLDLSRTADERLEKGYLNNTDILNTILDISDSIQDEYTNPILNQTKELSEEELESYITQINDLYTLMNEYLYEINTEIFGTRKY